MTKIQTYSGRMVDVRNINLNDVCLADIVFPLSRLARFNGHTRNFYSVAQHSVIVSLLVEDLTAEWTNWRARQRAAQWGLFHDGHEAYIGDIARPLKGLADKLCECSKAIDVRIRQRVGLWIEYDDPVYSAVKQADELALRIERRDLLGHCLSWGENDEPCVDVRNIDGRRWLSPEDAAHLFMDRYEELFGLETALKDALLPSRLLGARSGLFAVDQSSRVQSVEVDGSEEAAWNARMEKGKVQA